MKTLYFIRHAETEMNATADKIGGQSPHTPLTEKGIKQAHRLGEYLKNKGIIFDEIYSSDTVRARHTAEIAGEYVGFDAQNLKIRKELMEIDQGDWEGLPREFIYTSGVIKEILADNWNFKAPNGESQKDVEIRVFKLIDEILSTESDSEVIGIFSHGFTIRCFLRRILDSDARMSYRIAIENTSITKVTYDGEFWNIHKINGTSHLDC